MTSYHLLESIYFANYLEKESFAKKRYYAQNEILCDISMLDFYLEVLYKNKYISEKKSISMSKELEQIHQWVRGWMKSEKSDN